MSSLRTGQDHACWGWRSGEGSWLTHLDTLVSHELQTSTSVFSPAPILPEQRGGTDLERMQEDADLARLGCGAPIPLTLLTQRTGATTADTGPVHDAQASISFSALLMRDQLLVGGATQCPIWLERKVLSREATSFPGQAHLRESIARERGCVWWDG